MSFPNFLTLNELIFFYCFYIFHTFSTLQFHSAANTSYQGLCLLLYNKSNKFLCFCAVLVHFITWQIREFNLITAVLKKYSSPKCYQNLSSCYEKIHLCLAYCPERTRHFIIKHSTYLGAISSKCCIRWYSGWLVQSGSWSR